MINWDNMQENIRVTDLVYGAKSTFSNFASRIKIVSGSSQLPQSEGTSFQI
jgi:myosin heavy subunit